MIKKRSNAMAQRRSEGGWQLRVYHRNGTDKRGPRYLIKCGCCDESVEIYYGDEMLEINGVLGSVKDWQEILIPLFNAHRAGLNS